MARRGSLTLQDSIDEENRTVLASPDRKRSSSPLVRTGFSPTSPSSPYARNTLGVDSPTARHGSIAGIGVGVTSPGQTRKKRLDPSDPSTWTSSHTTSPTDARPRASSESQGAGLPTFQFDPASEAYRGATNTAGVTQAQTPPSPTTQRKGSSSMAAALSGEIDSLHIGTGQAPANIQPVRHLAPSPAGLGSGEEEGTDGRRFSNQSASFSSMTDDSDRIGAITRDDMKDEEDAMDDTSEEERSDSDQDVGSPVSERGRRRKHSLDATRDTDSEKTLVNPEIKIDDTSDPRKGQPHPPEHSGSLSETQSSITLRSNYRAASPAALSAIGDDDAELKRAKALPLRTSPLEEKIKDRTVKMVIRGDWASYQDAEEEDQAFRHEPRLYLVCSDLSNEASYALEWTVGTLLKDGDTILLISAMEDENASKHKDKEHEEPSLEVRLESAKAAEEANSTMAALTRQTTNTEGKPYEPKSRLASIKDPARSLSRSGRTPSKKDDERIKAIDKLENDFLRFVRKTTLQVRCMIEIIHCRSPRHLILNAIDELEPTLVVVGTRGQSTVRGVMLGSFSNYLVTKSSVPVMVARKRLKKAHHAKVSSQQIRMTNNLTPFGLGGKRRSLTQARID
ncbi:hypothetical protein PMZ80_008711 [Knufia obscura]|uniref:UspA domain-containing protein n=1 Tax=Knufia obscura TaxID=1635080 RepID=A0ABR0RFM2_9EURO|nr:hypothetical protein PMZ80_008711 [Knufia obscura]